MSLLREFVRSGILSYRRTTRIKRNGGVNIPVEPVDFSQEEYNNLSLFYAAKLEHVHVDGYCRKNIHGDFCN